MANLSTLLGGYRAFGRGYIDGLILANAADTEHDITVSIGEARDSTNAVNMALLAAITKRIDANWAVGTGEGGLDTGSVANSTWYHVFLIRKDADGSADALFSTSATAPTMPAGYTYKRRIGSVLTDGSANIIAFYQYNDLFLWKEPVADVSAAAIGTSAITPTLSTPLGVKVCPIVGAFIAKAASNPALFLSSPDITDSAVSGPVYNYYAIVAGLAAQCIMLGSNVTTNTSSQIRARASVASSTYSVNTHGWIDPRGKDA